MYSTSRLIEAIRVEEIKIVEIDEKVMQEDNKLMTMSTMPPITLKILGHFPRVLIALGATHLAISLLFT